MIAHLKLPLKLLQPLMWLKRIGLDVFHHMKDDDGWAMASHVAMSTLFAIFPFLIFLTTLAGFLGAGVYGQSVIDFIFATLPPDIAEPISNEVHAVLSTSRGDYLTIAAMMALYFSSNGVEALRVALNRAYRVRENRNFFYRRLQSLLFVFGAAAVLLITSVLLVIVPLAWTWIENHLPSIAAVLLQLVVWKNIILCAVLIIGLFAAHRWLPRGTRSLKQCVPGIALTLVAWIIGAWGLGIYISQFANYASTYAGLASGVILLLFLYLIAVILILGAELNAAIATERANK